LNTHVSRAMADLVAARSWLTVYRLPPYAHEFNPVEAVSSNLKRSLANLTKQNISELTARREGKIRAAGLSNHDIYQLEAAEEIGNVDAIQPPFNLIHRDVADNVLLWAREHEAGVIVYSPMASARRPGQIDGWLPAATLELKEDDLADIAAAVRATGADAGPASPFLEAAPGR
jgi:diketogulonate reductase-like aldo/keto reductase